MSLSSTQYYEIMRRYEEHRRDNRKQTEERKQEIYARIPEFQELDEATHRAISMRIARLREDPTNQTEQDKEAVLSLPDIEKRRKELLVKAGYPAEYLEPIHTCSDCQDTGYQLLPDGTRIKCHCLREQEIAILYEQSNLQGILSTDRFANLTYAYCQKQEDLERLQRAVKISLDFVEHFPDGQQNILYFGTVGTGKSFLSGCIANELLQKGFSVVYFSAVSLFETLARYSFGTFEKESLYNFCKDLYNYDLVIVDDLGTEMTNSFVQSQLFSLLNERVMRGRSTIISTNLNLGELRDRYSERVFSRITRSFTICMLTGPDVRVCQKLNAMPHGEGK